MNFSFWRAARWLLAVAALLPLAATAQTTLVITNGVQAYGALTSFTVTLSNRCELRVTNSTTPLTSCTINLNSSDAWLFLTGIKPSVAASTYLAQVFVSGAAAANLGYTPLNKAGDTAANLSLAFTALSTTSAGYLGAPRNEQDVAYTLALSDAGGMVRHNNASAYAHTIPPVASVGFPIGTAIVFRNYGVGVLTITRGAGVTLCIAGSGTSKDVAMAQYGFATAVMEDTNIWVIAGTGIS